ncbi:MAG TPA: ABC transporter substrate-binding protein [Chloroflexota bacterium]|nr:ABC transporter substrate-binding protein [Chloroflexota bacterium]
MMLKPTWRSFPLALVLILAACGSAAAPSTPPPSSPAPASAAPAKPAASASAKPAASAGASTAAKPAASAAASPAASGLTPVNVAITAIATTTIPTWVAEAKGFFKEQGLDAKVSYIAGSTSVIPALINGDVQIAETQAAASVQAQLKGQDTVSLATHAPYADLRFISQQNIMKMEDLKGKTVAVTKAGTVSDTVGRAVLPKFGLTPDKDVRIVYVDTQPGQLAALQNKSVDAMLTPPPFDLIAEKAGFRELFSVRTLNFPYPTDGVVTTRKYLKEHPDVVVKYLKAFEEAVHFAPANPDETKKILSAQTKETDPEILDAAYKAQMNDWADPPTPTIEGIQTILQLYGGEGKNPSDFIDPAPLAQAVKELGIK